MKNILLILSMFLLSGCFHKEVIREPYPVYTKVVCESPPTIVPIDPLPVVFVNGTDREGNEILGLRGDQYSNLAINGREVIRYISDQKGTIQYYKSCIELHNKKGEQ